MKITLSLADGLQRPAENWIKQQIAQRYLGLQRAVALAISGLSGQ